MGRLVQKMLGNTHKNEFGFILESRYRNSVLLWLARKDDRVVRLVRFGAFPDSDNSFQDVGKRCPSGGWMGLLVMGAPDAADHPRMSWNTEDFLVNLTWKYQHPPIGRTGDSISWVFPLMTLIETGPSEPSGYATGILRIVSALGLFGRRVRSKAHLSGPSS